jgi:hypothetical protein
VHSPPALPSTEMIQFPGAFEQGFNIDDQELQSLSEEGYRAWLHHMFQGLQRIAETRLSTIKLEFPTRSAKSFERYCQEWAKEVLKLQARRVDKDVRLRTKENFKFLAGRMADLKSASWYLASGGLRRKELNMQLTIKCSSLNHTTSLQGTLNIGETPPTLASCVPYKGPKPKPSPG